MTERIFKRTERDFWLYPKLLLVVVGCVVFTTILNRWIADSSVILLGFAPLIALFGFIGQPVTYRQWFIRILFLLVYFAVLFLMLHFARGHVGLTWNLPTAVLGIIGGSLLFGLSLTKRWVKWSNNKPFLLSYLVLFVAIWAVMGGFYHLLTMVLGK